MSKSNTHERTGAGTKVSAPVLFALHYPYYKMKGERRMTFKAKSGKAASIPAGLGISLAVNICVTCILTMLIAWMIKKNTVEWDYAGIMIMFTLLISSFLGAKAAIMTIKTQFLLISVMSGTMYWMSLICITAIFFGGEYCSLMETAALIASGSIAAALLRSSGKRASKRKRQYIPR